MDKHEIHQKIKNAVRSAEDSGAFKTPEDREKVFAELRKDPRVAEVSEYGGKISVRLRAEVLKIDVNVVFSKGASDD